MADTLLLCHTSAREARVAARLAPEAPGVHWLFLGEDYVRLLEWQDALEPFAERLDSGALLRQAAARLRRPFLDLITELGHRYDSLAWWGSRISERNTMVSPLLLHCCYLAVGETALADVPGTLCVVSQSRAVLDSLADSAEHRGVRVHRLGQPLPGSRRLLSSARIAARTARFVGGSVMRRLAASASRPPGAPPFVLLRTWVDASCFGPDGTFRDRYLDGLAPWLKERGCSVAAIPVLYNTGRSHRSAWRWLRANSLDFLDPAAHLRLTDLLFALRVARRQASMPEGPVSLDGLEVSRVFAEERERAAFDGGALQGIVSYRLPRRLAERGFRPDVFVDMFENMIEEKALNLGFRRYLPDTRLVGFQHGALSPLLVSNFITAGESTFAPIPDRVVCNGESFREILVGEGLPPERAVVGPALRYAHLWAANGASPDGVGRAAALVSLPLELQAGVELLVKLVRAFGETQTVQVLLKPHPMSSPERLFAAARLTELPPHFELVDGGMGEWLPHAGVLISLASSTLYEALAAGVPVVVVGRESALDLNPLAWYPELAAVFSTPEEIRDETARLLSLSPDDLDAYRIRGMEILRRSFNPVTDSAMSAFVEGFVKLSS
ncbi:MAG TPA: hypothetical protein VNY33_05345 [Gaiellaceae bacterium]|jgi:hypothetical protein|nr:hypothetical protein [Gaiellaceae bacterium]